MSTPVAKNQQPSTSTQRILLLNGPNLNLLGKREPEIYGHDKLSDIESRLIQQANNHDVTLLCHQSNSEAQLIDIIHQYGLLKPDSERVQAIIINPAAFTHTSVALRDALLAVKVPFIEVHLSNVHQREPFRQHSYFSDCAVGVICGLGTFGYDMALQYFITHR